jgi:hypothetical protein
VDEMGVKQKNESNAISRQAEPHLGIHSADTGLVEELRRVGGHDVPAKRGAIHVVEAGKQGDREHNSSQRRRGLKGLFVLAN